MSVELYQGDCLEVMKGLPSGSIDAIIADLPYGTTACAWDVIIPFGPLWAEYKRIIKSRGAIVLFGSQPFTTLLIASNLEWFRYCWVWRKERGQNFLLAKKQPLKSHEDISVFCQGQCVYNPQMTTAPESNIRQPQRHTAHYSEVYNHKKMASVDYDPTKRFPLSVLSFSCGRARDKVHPNEKPVALLEYLIRTYTNLGETVLDNTMGSGTTGIAAINTRRSFIGIELRQDYFDIAQRRISEAQQQVSDAKEQLTIDIDIELPVQMSIDME